MKSFPILILLLSLVGCTPVPVIPNLSQDNLKKIPYQHRPLIEMVASDYGRACEDILGRNFAEMGDEAFKNGFAVNSSSLEVNGWRIPSRRGFVYCIFVTQIN